MMAAGEMIAPMHLSRPNPGHHYTLLDSIHVAMLLWQGGERRLCQAVIATERRRGPGFLLLAQSLTALYPCGSEDRRLVEGMLATEHVTPDDAAEWLPADWRAALAPAAGEAGADHGD